MARIKVTREQKKLLKTIRKNAQDPEPLARLAWTFFDQQQYDEAQHYFQQAIDLKSPASSTADALYGMALLDLQRKHYEYARDDLRRIIRDFPDFQKRPEVHFALGQANDQLWRTREWTDEKEKFGSEFLQRAIDHYEQAIERRSTQQDAAGLMIGKLLYEIGEQDRALPFLQRVGQSPSLQASQRFDANVLTGQILLEHKQEAAAAKGFFEAALKGGAQQARLRSVYHSLGHICKSLEQDGQALIYYEKAASAYQDEQTADALDVLVNLSELQYRQHHTQEALDSARKGIVFSELPDASRQRLLQVLAGAASALRQYEQARDYEEHYLKFVRDSSAKAASLLRIGSLCEELGNGKEAIDAYRKGLKYAKKKFPAGKLHAALGRMYLHENRLNQAANHLKEAAEFGRDDEAHSAHVAWLQGQCYMQRGERQRAIEAYGRVVEKFSGSAEASQARQALKACRKSLKKAIQDLERTEHAEDAQTPMALPEASEQELLLELIEDILDEKSFFERLKEGLSKTHMSLVGKIEDLLANRTSVDDTLIEELEELLILSDMGVSTTQQIIARLREKVDRRELQKASQIKFHLKREVLAILEGHEKRLDLSREKPYVILVIGVNGTGKTTTIGKMAGKFTAQGRKVLLVAGDTFRAAAIEQLEIWGERTGCDVMKHASGSDPSAVMFDAVHAARSRHVDVMIADTAGRLHTKKNLMEELRKMVRILSREMPGAPHEILMVIDSTTGQNAISQAKLFNEAVGVTGFVLTKLDGTAKGGIIVGIAHDMNIPVTFIGIGEQVEDLREFHAEEFVEALFED
ncbi:signal recognition particle-docking protein FtsY [candidate division KSB3 bacterium]|uniref:Signal recognition particle receptor FtsY n=1 Tax=candidate division KSB3 bacterium TaxID=2044937 RepID=A0A2G6E5X4_9BACT|nr:MAG: signal recognition particle-docking protein FtsY [candidate division KSB3 bacterium]PIE29865.1 MAG: signal recognition particle-docking protein FtsY [candidate division KSB3 bacterium]